MYSNHNGVQCMKRTTYATWSESKGLLLLVVNGLLQTLVCMITNYTLWRVMVSHAVLFTIKMKKGTENYVTTSGAHHILSHCVVRSQA